MTVPFGTGSLGAQRPAARPWQALSDLDGPSRRGGGIPAGFIALGCIAVAAGAFMLIYRLINASPFSTDPIARLVLTSPGAVPGVAETAPSTQGAVLASDAGSAEPGSFVGLSSTSTNVMVPAPATPPKPANAAAPAPPPTLAPTPPPAPIATAIAAAAPARLDGKSLALATSVETTSLAQQISGQVDRWAQAWSRRDVDMYLASYAPDYRGRTPTSTHEAWAGERRTRILSKQRISVTVSDLQVSADGDRAVARFVQQYQGDALRMTHRKTLSFRLDRGQWLIAEESESP